MSDRQANIEKIKAGAETIISRSVGSIDPEENAKAIALSDARVIEFLADRLDESLVLRSFKALTRQSPNLLDYDLIIEFTKETADESPLSGAGPIDSLAHLVVEIPTRTVKAIRHPVDEGALQVSPTTPLALIAPQQALRTFGPVSSGVAGLGFSPVPPEALAMRRSSAADPQRSITERFGLTAEEAVGFSPRQAAGPARAAGTDIMTNINSVSPKTTTTGTPTAVGTNSSSGFPPQLDDSITDEITDGSPDTTFDTTIDEQIDEREA